MEHPQLKERRYRI